MPSRTIRELRELAEDEGVDPEFRKRARRIAEVFERRIAELEAAGVDVEDNPPPANVEIDARLLSS